MIGRIAEETGLSISARIWSGPGAFRLGSFLRAYVRVSILKGDGLLKMLIGVMLMNEGVGDLVLSRDPSKTAAKVFAIILAAAWGPIGDVKEGEGLRLLRIDLICRVVSW
jgi:hypothetical protein